MNYRIDLAGGWLDQPFVSKLHSGPVVVANVVESEGKFFLPRCGMATSTRDVAQVYKGVLDDLSTPERKAQVLYALENMPNDKGYASGSQDAYGTIYPGVNALVYNGNRFPDKVVALPNHEWLERHLWFKLIQPRDSGFNPKDGCRLWERGVGMLADGAAAVMSAMYQPSLTQLGIGMSLSFSAQLNLFPAMVDGRLAEKIDAALFGETPFGYKLAGAGGGGYLVAVFDDPPVGKDWFQVKISRP